MKKLNRILSTILALLMMLSAFSGLSVIGTSAAVSEETRIEFRDQYGTNTKFNTPEEKLASMELVYSDHGYEMYLFAATGEVAVKELATGQILFTNPYDVASSKADIATTKQELLSQVIITCLDKSNNNKKVLLNSFYDAAALGQIVASRIKNGLRIEYTIGEQISKRLVPKQITADRYFEYILKPITEAYEANKLLEEEDYSFINDIDIEMFDPGYFTEDEGDAKTKARESGLGYNLLTLSTIKTEDNKQKQLEAYPILATTDIWKLSPDIPDAEMATFEALIMKYCPEYTYELMEEDHEMTGYKGLDVSYPVFKLALEYTLDEDGMVVRMPANGLRYDAEKFFLDSIQILPYLGAGHSANGGYSFFPDGSGALFDFDELKKSTLTFTQPIYGIDYAYSKIQELGYRTPVRYPVYGVVANEQFITYSYKDKNGNLTTPVTVSSTVKSLETIKKEVAAANGTNLDIKVSKEYSRGYVAIIESGDSLTTLSAYQSSNNSEYGTVLNYFNPVPYDEFDLSDTASVSANSKFLLISPRKYTGSLKIRYKMLTDEKIAADVHATNPAYKEYATTWLGMAEFYRDYLVKTNVLKKLSNEDVEADIPLYIESFGAIETQQMVMTLPVNVMTPLTTFENIGEMFDQLATLNVTNINFKMTGFANGGMYSTVPAKLKWEKAVGGKSGFRDLIQKAQAVNAADDDLHLGLYPDFDFAHISNDTLFDSTRLKKDAVTSIDNRYASKQFYSASQQKYMTFYQLLVSPSRYDKFYTKLMDKYADYDISSISLGSLGNALNSDFDEDEAYVREDSKDQTVAALEAIKNSNNKQYDIMLDSANAYTWKYANHIINLDLESSRHNKASAAVPFIGAVLHGYIQFAGAPLNEEANISGALLKAIENGAGLYFILSFQSENIPYLKEDFFLSQYYSVRYDIWYQDVSKYYTYLNGLLKDVQTKVMIDHEFLNTNIERIMDLDEIQDQINSDLQDAINSSNQNHTGVNLEIALAIANARVYAADILAGKGSMETLLSSIADLKAANAEIDSKYVEMTTAVDGFASFIETEIAAGTDGLRNRVRTEAYRIRDLAIKIMKASANVKSNAYTANKLLEKYEAAFASAKDVINNSETLAADVKALYLKEIADAEAQLTAAKAELATESDLHEAKYDGKTEQSAEFYAVKIIDVIDSFTHADDAVKNEISKVFDRNNAKFTAGQIAANGVFIEPEDEKDDNEGDATGSSAFSVDKNSVVAVTYGDVVTDANGVTQKVAYKTFLLNYNSYAVRLTYNGILYTIPAGGCIALYH